MTFTDVLKEILLTVKKPLTPQEIRSVIKDKYTQHYGTSSHINNVCKGHYKDLEHALLAKIYSTVRTNSTFFCDTDNKPMRISLQKREVDLVPKSERVPRKNNDTNEADLIKNIRHYYRRSLAVMKDFGGPSIYFHIQAIRELENEFLSDRHIEMIYATLASWGMHKMGDPYLTKAKLVDFYDFKNSILSHKEQLKQLSGLRMDSCNQVQYEKYIENLENIYFNLKVSISEATIVAHSKTLAHILPDLIPPIDRQYTIRFFTQERSNIFSVSGKYKSVTLPQDKSAQFSDFKTYCCKIKSLYDRIEYRIFTIDKQSFNTSYPKIMDNIIMAFIKDVEKPSKNGNRNEL
jgi:hypothetical protein